MIKQKFRYIATGFWDDEWIQTLDPSEKLLYLYFMTNPLTNIAGIYKITIRRICFDTGFNSDTIGHILGKFNKAKKVYMCGEWIILPNWPKYQKIGEKDNNRKGIDTILKEIPDDVFQFVIEHEYNYQYIDVLGRKVQAPCKPLASPLNYSNLNLNLNLNSNLNKSGDSCESLCDDKKDSPIDDNSLPSSEDLMDGKEKQPPDEAIKLATLLFTLHKQLIDNKYFVADSKISAWAKDIDKIKRIDGREWEEIDRAIRWVKNPDCFWASNIMSGKKLRDKFATIIAQMQRGGGQKQELKVFNRTATLDIPEV